MYFLKRLFICIFHVRVFCLHVYMYGMTQRPEEGVRSLGPGVLDGCAFPWGCWEANPGPPAELLVSAASC